MNRCAAEGGVGVGITGEVMEEGSGDSYYPLDPPVDTRTTGQVNAHDVTTGACLTSALHRCDISQPTVRFSCCPCRSSAVGCGLLCANLCQLRWPHLRKRNHVCIYLQPVCLDGCLYIIRSLFYPHT